MKKFNMMKFSTIKLIILFSLTTIFFITCKKGSISEAVAESLFDDNVIGENFVIALATDNGVDITGKYAGYVFVLSKTDLYNGSLQAKKNGVISTGSWSTNDDYSKLTIILPATPSEFVFLSRSWRFTKKSTTILKLAPWGSNDPIVLHMVRQ